MFFSVNETAALPVRRAAKEEEGKKGNLRDDASNHLQCELFIQGVKSKGPLKYRFSFSSPSLLHSALSSLYRRKLIAAPSLLSLLRYRHAIPSSLRFDDPSFPCRCRCE